MEKLKRFKKPLVLLSLALVLALVWTTGASTYAKYITSKTVTPQTATVAKWGFIVDANTEKLFGNAYGAATSNLSSVVAYDSAINVKASSENSNVVAPGTKGEMTFKIGGSAEVLSKITVTASGTDNVHLTKTKTADSTKQTYSPITWTLKKGTEVIKTGKLADIVTYINSGIEIYNAGGTTIKTNGGEIKPNTTIAETTFTLSWEWTFENNSATSIAKDNTKTPLVYYTGNEADTILGQFANETALPKAETGYEFSAGKDITFNFTITIEQIQK